jgi:hypothetical protein
MGLTVGLFSSNEKVAIGIGARRARLLVGRGNGHVTQVYSGSAALPATALRVGLRAPVFTDRESILGALRELVSAARAEGLLRRTPEVVTVLVSDGAFKMAAAPIEGDAPNRADGDRMARWMLRDLLPVQENEIRADWTVLDAPEGDSAETMLLSLGGAEAVLADYEALVAELGWTVGRIVPWSFAAAAARPRDVDGGAAGNHRDLVLCEADGTLGALFQTDGLPRLHRAWRSPVAAERVAEELPALRRYVNDHLDTSIGGVWLCGDSAWADAASIACETNQVPSRVLTPDAALCAALED